MENGGTYMKATVNFTTPDGKKVDPEDRFVCSRWITMDHAIPFEFKDVPLP